MAKTREDFIITNRVCINNYKDIVRKDFADLNTKYVMITNTSNEINHKMHSSLDNSAYFDGFDFGFDIISMK